MKITRKLIYLILISFILSACQSSPSVHESKIEPFTFINQNNEPFGTEDLTGTVWIANFIFTKCDTVCIPMTSEMAALQKLLNNEGIPVEFISFTVDPAIDSPQALKQYIEKYTTDESNWHMLTGYTQKEIETFAMNQFQTMILKPDDSNQVIHGTNFYLIDQHHSIINEYNYTDDAYVEKILEDIEELYNE